MKTLMAMTADQIGFLAAFFVVIVVIFVGYHFAGKYGPRGSVIMAAVAVFFMGLLLRGIDDRIVMLISGACSLAGLAGLLFGLFDLLRKKPDAPRRQRKPKW